MSKPPSLDDLWNSALSSVCVFDPARVEGLPAGPRRYLQHAIAAETPLASCVRLRMHDEIKLKGWCPFSAEEVIGWEHGMIWRATVRMHGIPIRGGDSFVEVQGVMNWKLFGIILFIHVSGPDINRSAADRINIEAKWLPSVLCGNGVSWTASDAFRSHARFDAHNESADIDCRIDEESRLKTINMPRWGDPGGAKFGYVSFVGIVEEEKSFGGYTIPSRTRAGWYFGTDRFESEREFFQVTIDDASFR